MGISISGTVNPANAKYHKSQGSGGIDWSIIPSSGKSSKSKAEFDDEIRELARRAAGTTDKKELEYIHSQRTRLCAEHISDVSPDRKALYQQAGNALKGQASPVFRQIGKSGNRDRVCFGMGDKNCLDLFMREKERL